MNIALPRSRTGHKSPYQAALFAALPVLALIAAVGIWQTADSGKASPAPTSRSSTLQVTPSHPALILYVVDSDEQYNLATAGENEAANERATANMRDTGYTFLIVKATTLEEEQNVAEIIDGWMSTNSIVNVVDVRAR